MPFDPSLPAPNSPNSSAVMRDQLNSLKALIDLIATVTNAQVTSVGTLPPGDPATASVSYTDGTLYFTFALPRGQDGQTGPTGPEGGPGPQGAQGPPGEVTLGQLALAISGTSNNSNGVLPLGQTADSSYSPSQMQDVLNKMDELIQALRR